MELSTRTVEASTAKVRSQHRSATHVARRAKPRAKLLLVHWPILHKSRETCIANARPPIGILSQPSVDRLKRKGERKKGGRGRKRETCCFHSGLIDAQHPRGAIKIPVSHSIIFFALHAGPLFIRPFSSPIHRSIFLRLGVFRAPYR